MDAKGGGKKTCVVVETPSGDNQAVLEGVSWLRGCGGMLVIFEDNYSRFWLSMRVDVTSKT